MAQQRDVLARARALQELVRAEAPRTESQRTLTAPVVQALLDAELFYLMVPAALGGLEVDGRTYLGNRSGSENLTLAIQSPHSIPCHHGNTACIPPRGVGTDPIRSASLYSGTGSAC